MKKTKLQDGSSIHCLSTIEAQMLDKHIDGYLIDFIKINKGDTIIDVGANIGLLGLHLSKIYDHIEIYACEPIEEIYNVLEANALLSKNKNFNTFQFGLSNKNESIEFNYYPNSPAMSNCNPEIWSKIVENL